jgi:pentatricopeptide repeat protein
VLEQLPVRNTASWNALIAAYSRHDDQGQEALHCLELMQTEGLSSNEATFACILKACGNANALSKGLEIHNEIINRGWLKNIVLGNALVFMYVKCGMLVKARAVLEDLPLRNVISWSAIIAGYAQYGHNHEAFLCYEHMLSEGVSPNNVTFICILKAIAGTGAMDKGKKIHNHVIVNGLLDNSIALGNALVDMYAKCGALSIATNVLEELEDRNIVSWNALISGYAQQRRANEALSCLSLIQKEGLSPNKITFLCVLNACAHAQWMRCRLVMKA